jgi:RNA polymerase sigma-70 factor (ECF subfamily)
MDPAATFERYRTRLFSIAYGMLGSVEEAEDIVQETYLRWHRAEVDAVRSPEAWLVAVVSRLAIDRLRRVTTERAAYGGTWLPEPLASDRERPEFRAELASELSMAFLVLLERLGPEERAALLLHDVFDWGYDEIARTLEKSEAACRQLVHRARERVRRVRPRFPVPADAKERLLGRFLDALAADDEQEVLALLAEDATFAADGGGRVPSVRRVVRGASRVAKLLLGYERKGRGLVTHRIGWLNGEPAIVTYLGDRVAFTTSVDTDGERIYACYRVLDPEKLRRVAAG